MRTSYGPDSPFIHPRRFLNEMPSHTLTAEQFGRVLHGQDVNLPDYSDAPLVKVFHGQDILVAIMRRVAGTLFHPEKVLYGPGDPLE